MRDIWTLHPYQQECKRILDQAPKRPSLIIKASAEAAAGETEFVFHYKIK